MYGLTWTSRSSLLKPDIFNFKRQEIFYGEGAESVENI